MGNRLGLLDGLVALSEDEFDVAGVGHVRVDLHMLLDGPFARVGFQRTRP